MSRKIKTVRWLALSIALFAAGVNSHELGFAGLLSGKNRGEIPELTLAAGEPLTAVSEINLQSGGYYELIITADGSAELGLSGAGFFRAIWVDEVVINGLEVRPLGLDSVEFDDAGVMEIGFVAIKPGSYSLSVPGSTGDTQRVAINIR